MNETDLAYIAGLFDGEGHVQYKQYMRQRKHNIKPYPTWSIRMEMAMTDRSILIWSPAGTLYTFYDRNVGTL